MEIDRLPGLIELKPNEKVPEKLTSEQELGSKKKWHGIGGTTIGVIGGAALGSFGLGLVNMMHLGGTFTGGFIAGGIGGAVIGGIIGAVTGTDSVDRFSQREQDLFGHDPKTAASMLVEAFDHNENSQIDLIDEFGLDETNENIVIDFKTTRETSRSISPDWTGDGLFKVNKTTVNVPWERKISARPLFAKADTDSNSVVSLDELTTYMKSLDTDGNGAVSVTEQQALRGNNLITITPWRRS